MKAESIRQSNLIPFGEACFDMATPIRIMCACIEIRSKYNYVNNLIMMRRAPVAAAEMANDGNRFD